MDLNGWYIVVGVYAMRARRLLAWLLCMAVGGGGGGGDVVPRVIISFRHRRGKKEAERRRMEWDATAATATFASIGTRLAYRLVYSPSLSSLLLPTVVSRETAYRRPLAKVHSRGTDGVAGWRPPSREDEEGWRSSCCLEA